MEVESSVCSSSAPPSEEEMDLRRGPWTLEEDLILINHIANHGEGRWNSLARCAGLKRTGKSCRLRWLNYLRPDVRRGNITPEEQLLIFELHSQWGNRWSKIAQHLPGRTDNEIKNYWRTRVQKHAKQLQCDVNSGKFKAVMRYLWMPRLLERIQAASGSSPVPAYHHPVPTAGMPDHPSGELGQLKPSLESSTPAESSSSEVYAPVSDCLSGCYPKQDAEIMRGGGIQASPSGGCLPEGILSPSGYCNRVLPDLDLGGCGGDLSENLWNLDDLWLIQQGL